MPSQAGRPGVLKEKVADNFSRNVRSHAISYYRQGRVQLHEFDAERQQIDSLVHGSMIYAVTLAFEPGS